jgi:hypothetical protein
VNYEQLSTQNTFWRQLTPEFQEVETGTISLENVRLKLHAMNEVQFPKGQ